MRLQDDFAGLGQILMPVQDYVPDRAEPRGRAHQTAVHARTDVSGEEAKPFVPSHRGLGEESIRHPVDAMSVSYTHLTLPTKA